MAILKVLGSDSKYIGSPVGTISIWIGGYFGDGSNGSYTRVLATDNTTAAVNTYLNPTGWYVCDGSVLNDSESPIFNGAGRYLPNISDSRFLQGSSTCGTPGGSNTNAHTHNMQHVHSFVSTSDVGSYSRHRAFNSATTAYSNVTPSSQGDLFDDTNIQSGTGVIVKTSASQNTANWWTGRPADSSAAAKDDTATPSDTENRPNYLNVFYIIKVK